VEVNAVFGHCGTRVRVAIPVGTTEVRRENNKAPGIARLRQREENSFARSKGSPLVVVKITSRGVDFPFVVKRAKDYDNLVTLANGLRESASMFVPRRLSPPCFSRASAAKLSYHLDQFTGSTPCRHINNIESFWSYATTRLARLRGIRA